MSQTKEQANFAAIRANVRMQMLLDHYSISLKKQGQELRGKCPLPGCEAGERSFQVNPTKNVFHCFSCKAGGNVIELVAKMEECNIREAGLRIQQWFDLTGKTSTPPALQQPEEPRGAHQTEPPPPSTSTPSDTEFYCLQYAILATLKAILTELRSLRQDLQAK